MDYVHGPAQSFVQLGLAALTLYVVILLFKYNTDDIGITQAFSDVWNIKRPEAVAESLD